MRLRMIRVLPVWALLWAFIPLSSSVASTPAFVGNINCTGGIDVTDVQIVIMKTLGLPLDPMIDEDQDGVPDACQITDFSGGCAPGQIIKWMGTHWECAEDELGAQPEVTKEELVALQMELEALKAQCNQLPTATDVAESIAEATDPLSNQLTGLASEVADLPTATEMSDAIANATNLFSAQLDALAFQVDKLPSVGDVAESITEGLGLLEELIAKLASEVQALPTATDVAAAIADATEPINSIISELTSAVDESKEELSELGEDLASQEQGVLAYEPWNPSILLSPISIYDKIYFLSFRAPSSGFYTNATIKTSTGPNNYNKKFQGQLSVGIYRSVTPASPVEPISNYPIQNVPSLKLGEAVHVYTSETDIRGFVEFTFNEPIYLTKGSTYWFAVTVHNEQNSSHKIFMDFHVDYSELNGDVLEASDDTWGELPATAPTGGALDFSDRAIWYRLSGPKPEESADSEESESSFDSAAMEISP